MQSKSNALLFLNLLIFLTPQKAAIALYINTVIKLWFSKKYLLFREKKQIYPYNGAHKTSSVR